MPRHAQKAPKREIRAFACAAVAAPWLVLGLVCSLQPVQTLWLLRALLLAAIATLQPHSPYISDKVPPNKPKRHPKSPAESQPTLSWASRQPDVFNTSKPQHRSRVSTSKPLSSNKWSPKPASALPGHTCSNSRTAGTSNSSTGKGPSNSNPQTTTGNTSSHSSGNTTAAPAGKSCFSGGNSGGWDDSDDGGGGGDKPRFQAVKSHSLDAPDSAAIAVSASEEHTPVNSRANSSSNTSSSNVPTGSVPSLCDTAPSGEALVSPVSGAVIAAAEDTAAISPLPSSGIAAQPATTGPWKLSSPFSAAMTPFDSGSSASSTQSSNAAGSAVAVQQRAQQQQQGAIPPAAAVTGPWKLASPFAAAPLPAFSGSLDATATTAPDAPANKPAKQKLPVAEVLVDSKQQQKDKQQRQPRHYYEPAHMRLQKPKPPKQQYQQQQQVASQKGTTGPWALHSPFAAAAAPPTLEVKDTAAVACDASSTPAAATAGMVVSDPFGSPLPAQYGQEHQLAAAAGSPTAAAAAAGSSKDTSKAERKRERRRSALTIAPQPPSPNTGPWGLYSPFAAAVAAEAAPSNTAAQLQPPGSSSSTEQSPAELTVRSGPSGIARSRRSGSGGNLGQLPADSSRAEAAVDSAPPSSGQGISRDSSSDRLTDTTAATPSSIHTVSESRGSLPFSFPSVGISAGASDATSAVTSSGTSGGLNDCLDLDLQPTPGAFAASWAGGEGLSHVPSDTELAMPQGEDPTSAAGLDAAAGGGGGGGFIGAARVHDSAHSHLLQQKLAPGSAAAPGKSAIAAGLAVPSVAVQQQPFLVAPGAPAAAAPAPQAAGGVPQVVVAPAVVGVAPAVVPAPAAPMAATYIAPTGAVSLGPFDASPRTSLEAAAAAAYAGVQRSSFTAVPATATAGSSLYPIPAAAAATGNPAVQLAAAAWPPQIKTPTPAEAAGHSPSATPASPMAASAAVAEASAAVAAVTAAAAAASKAKDMSCLCCYPPCLSEGQAADVHVYITGLDLSAEAVLRAVVVRGSVIVADVTGLCRPTDGLFRVPVPALPNGPLQLGIFLDKHLCFTQTLLILPGPSAQEMILLWGSLLQSHLALQQQQQQVLAGRQGSDKGSMEIGSDSIGSGWNSRGSTSSAGSAGGAPGGQQGYPCTEEAIAAAAATWMAAPSEPGQQQQQQQGSVGGVSSVDVQVVWQKQYTPVLIDIAYLLTAQMQKATVSPPAAAAAAAASPFAGPSRESSSPRSTSTAAAAQAQINMDSPEFKSMVTHLVQFLAANGLWAVLQLITDSVYGVGASAKALYTAKAATSAAASAAASGKGGYEGGGGSSGSSSTGAITRGVSQAVQVPDATPESQDTIATIGSSIGALAAPAAVDPAAAVATAVAGVEAGQSLDVGAVLLLLCLVVKNSVVCGVKFYQVEGLLPVLRHVARAGSRGVRQLGSWAFEGLALLVCGILWVYDTLVGTVHAGGKGAEAQSMDELSYTPPAAATSGASSATDSVAGSTEG